MEKETGVNPTGGNPYVGPRTFTTQESHLFFGREGEARDLVSLVISEHIVLFYAQSGAGKSSLINTRLVPMLQKKGFEVLPIGRVSGAILPDEPLDNVFTFNLQLSLDQSKREPQRFVHLSLTDFLANLNAAGEHYLYGAEPPAGPAGSAAPAAALAGDQSEGRPEAQAAAPPAGPLEIWPRALVIDQFEELFTTHPEAWERRADFLRQVADALQADPYLWVVLTLREDHVAALDPYAALLPGRLRARFYMQRMGSKAALEAVRLPVARLRPFAPGVAELLVDNLALISSDQAPGVARQMVAGEFIEPVQLQVVCYQLWETLQAEQKSGEAQQQITTADLTRLAKGADLAQFVNQSLADFYEQCLAKVLQAPEIAGAAPGSATLTESQLRDWFSTRLITEAETRAFVYQGEEQTAGLPNAAVAVLAAQHIIRSEVRAGGVWNELVHDRLVNPILQSNRAWLRNRLKPITQAAEAWAAADRAEIKLYDGNLLKEALASADPQKLSPLEREFLDASSAVAHTRRSRGRRFALSGATLIFLIMAALTIWAMTQQSIAFQQATRAAQEAERARQEEINARVQEAFAKTQEAASKLQEATAVKAVSEVQDQIFQQQTTIPMYRNTIAAVQKLLATPSLIPTLPKLTLIATLRPTSLSTVEPPTLTLAPDSGVTSVLIGHSVKGTELRVVRVGSGERSILVVGGMHAGYAPSSVRAAQAILNYYAQNPRLVPPGSSLHVLVNANPDSPARPGEQPGRYNANLVDLNRNWDCNWGAPSTLHDPSLSTGSEPFSEPETRALRDYTRKILPAAVISYEATSTGWVVPGGCMGKSIFSYPLARVYVNSSGYDLYGGNPDAIGNSQDWLDLQGSPAIVVLLTDYVTVDSNDLHIKAIQAVLDWNGK